MQTVDVAVFLESELGLDFVVGIAGRDYKVSLRRARGDDALFDRIFRKDQADARSICSGFAGRDVVNLEDEHRAFFDQLSLAGPQNQRGFAGRPSDQTAVRIGWTLAPRAPAAPRGEEFIRRNLSRRGQWPVFQVTHVNDHVMHDPAIALSNLGELHVLVFGEIGRDGEIFIRDHAFCGHAVFDGHREHDVWFADLPAFGVFRARRHVFRIAFIRAAFDPGDDGVDLLLREARVVGELAVSGIGEPGRHRARHYLFADGLGPGPDLLVVSE